MYRYSVVRKNTFLTFLPSFPPTLLPSSCLPTFLPTYILSDRSFHLPFYTELRRCFSARHTHAENCLECWCYLQKQSSRSDVEAFLEFQRAPKKLQIHVQKSIKKQDRWARFGPFWHTFCTQMAFGEPLKTSLRKNTENDSPGRAILGPHFEAFFA